MNADLERVRQCVLRAKRTLDLFSVDYDSGQWEGPVGDAEHDGAKEALDAALAILDRMQAPAAGQEPVASPPTTALTKPQLEELHRLATGPQWMFGSSRARAQNALAARGMAIFVDVHGKTSTRVLAHHCLITEDGLAYLCALRTLDIAPAPPTPTRG